MPSKKPTRLIGYVHVYEGEESPETQIAAIEAKARELGEEVAEHYVDVEPLGVNRPYDKRLHFRRLLDDIQSGDVVIVAELACIARNPMNLPEALRRLANWRITLYVLDLKIAAELVGERLGTLITVLDAFVDVFRKQNRSRARRGVRNRREVGLAANGNVPLGRKRIRIADPRNARRKLKVDIWYEPEMRQIREIAARYQHGETGCEIGYDFFKRGEVTAMGRKWVRRYGYRQRLSYTRIYGAIRLMRKIVEAGDESHPLAIGWEPQTRASPQAVTAKESTD